MPRKQTKPKPTEGQPSLFDGIVPNDADDVAHMDVDATLEFDEKVEGAVNNLLRGRMAALRGARRLAYLQDMSRLLRSGRLALQPLATVVRGAPLRQ